MTSKATLRKALRQGIQRVKDLLDEHSKKDLQNRPFLIGCAEWAKQTEAALATPSARQGVASVGQLLDRLIHLAIETEGAYDRECAAAQAAQAAGTVSEEHALRVGQLIGVLNNFGVHIGSVVANAAVADLNALLRQPPSAPAKETATPTLEFNLAQAEALVDLFGGEDSLMTVTRHEGVLKAWSTEYPDEGSSILEEVPTLATPAVQPDAQVMERAREVAENFAKTWHDYSPSRKQEVDCLTRNIAALVTRECNAARLAALEEAAQLVEKHNQDLMTRWNEVTKEPPLEQKIRALAAKEQPHD